MSTIRRQDVVAGVTTPNNRAFAPRRIFAQTSMATMATCMTNKGHTVSGVTADNFDCDGQTVEKADMDKCNFKPYGALEIDLRACSNEQGGCL
jgi:hypothetical protein